nr:circadian clock-controlled protein-like [Leptinotarsa decemlineata]
MFLYRLNFLVVLAVTATLIYGYQFPDAFKRCHFSDPNLDSCLDSTIENAFQIIGGSGIAALNLPPIDPAKFTSIVIGAGTSAVNLVQNYHDVKVIGFSKIKVKDSHYDSQKNTLEFSSLHPEIRQEAKYDINGKILVIPVFGKGDSIITLRDVTIVHTVTFEKKTKNNRAHLTVKSYDMKITIKGAHFDFRNLFNGNEKLSDNIHKVVNENWNVIYEDVREGVQKAYGEAFKLVTNEFFEKIPVDEIFLK